MPLDFASVETLQKTHPAWRLLVAEHAPLIVSFLHRVFVIPNRRGAPRGWLVGQLEDDLFELRRERGPEAYPREAASYLDAWAQEGQGWLRKYYPMGADEPYFDLTPSAEKALTWLEGLTQRSFVGTESRLLTVFELLRQLVHGSGADPDARLADLERRKVALEREIDAVKSGNAPLFDEVALRDRFQQVATTARELLADFREVEQNFRQLDRETRERIARWVGGKGELLNSILGERDSINGSDQGRSFQAFWDFLMDPGRQEELRHLWEVVFALPPIRELEPDARLKRIHDDWLEAGGHTQRTVAQLSKQLRRFLDDRAWMESRRVMELIQGIETHALLLRDDLPRGPFFEVDGVGADVELPLERPLYSPPLKAEHQVAVLAGKETDVDAQALFGHDLVDRVALETRLSASLVRRPQVTLANLTAEHPLHQGLAELVVWLQVATDRPQTVFDDSVVEPIDWDGVPGRRRRARLSRVIFSAEATPHER
jgi:flagellar motility protein MotE (MotC chaperone)